MKPQGSHAHEDRLLDFAYDELPPTEAQQMEQHVQGCARCSEALHGIRGVRTTMSRLPLESAPDAGLESLMAYAQQAARRSAAGPEPAPRWWRRLLAPALGMAAVSVFGVVVFQVNREVELSPVPSQKAIAQERISGENKDETSPPVPPPAPAAPVSPRAEQLHAQFDEEMRGRADWSNAGAGSPGGLPEKKVARGDDKGLGSFGGYSTKGTSRAKREVAVSKSLPSPSTAPRAEPTPDWDGAQAQEQVEAAPAIIDGPIPGGSQQAVRYEPSGNALKIGGSTARPTSVESVASADDYAQRQAPGRAQAPAAMSPPPPPPPMEQPSIAAGAVVRAEGMEARKAEEAESPREKASAAKRAPSPAELLRQADVASRSGDKEQEVAFLRAALTAGAQGAQLVDALSRLCEAEFELGRRQSAIDICRRLIREAPGSRAARLAQSRLEGELLSPADEAGSESKSAAPETK
ncbi:zf-HC2 domain-containing protein [Archangium lipolyticum]|uniref:zf-HC2 domain-containing protein n=1 Tax=Archangium lipolyticum TaxID=2970465 RepID=UPI002149F14C|nr:zf-HC2 domain-containing protein [Archangium lipolyticum]